MTAPELSEARTWLGWRTIDTIFSFGDSYTTTGFDIQGPQPRESNCIGNPDFYGSTSSNGPNWVGYLATKYNQRFVKLYNLACGGATVASSLIHRFHPEYRSLEQQVLDDFMPKYAALGKPKSSCVDQVSVPSRADAGVEGASGAAWSSESTLFAFFFGINDVGLCYADNDASVYDEYLRVYRRMVMELCKAGARNLLFVNVPPVDRAPLTTEQGADMMAKEAEHIRYWNHGLVEMTLDLRKQYAGLTLFLYDAHTTYSQVLDDPKTFPETSVYRDTTSWAPEYEMGTPEMDTRLPGVALAVNEFLWLNSLHPTYPVHDLCAKQIAEQLS